MRSRIGFAVRDDGCGCGKSRQPLPLPAAGSRTAARFPNPTAAVRTMSKADKIKARVPRGFADRTPADLAATERMLAAIRDDLRALRLRGRRDAVRRIHGRAGQVPARPGPPERRRVLVPGRRRAVAVAALRPDRAARPLRGRELRRPAEALSQLSRRLGVPQREARTGPLPPVHAVRRRHGGRGLRRRGCGNLHDGRRHDGAARASSAATTSSRSTTARCSTACSKPSASAARTRPVSA